VLVPVAEGLALVRPDGGKWRFTATTASGRTSYLLTTIEDARGLVTTLAYNSAKQLQRVIEPAGRTLTLAYEVQSINAVDFSTLATVGTDPASGQWVELIPTSTTAYRYVRLLSADLAHARFAEIECFEAGTGGTVIGTDAADQMSLALDGDPATPFVAKYDGPSSSPRAG
jgi:YD repeat-containing protein